MKKIFLLFLLFTSISKSQDKVFETQKIFETQRFPNIVVAKNGFIITTWGAESLVSRISKDGGKTWENQIKICDGINGGGLTVDETTGDIIAFAEKKHPPSEIISYRSKDNGQSWQRNFIKVHPDKYGNIPSMHMNEHGITVKNGKFKGRLIRPSRYYSKGNQKEFYGEHYSNAIYSNDGGINWYSSNPFPAFGTGEGAIVELKNGVLLYNSRRHFSNDGLNPKMRHIANSNDGGINWNKLQVSNILPDGQQNSNYGLMGGLDQFNWKGKNVIVFTNIESFKEGRRNGVIWASFDEGKTWPIKKTIDEEGFKYSSIAVGRKNTVSEDLIYVFYETGKENNVHDYGGGKVAMFNIQWLLE